MIGGIGHGGINLAVLHQDLSALQAVRLTQVARSLRKPKPSVSVHG